MKSSMSQCWVLTRLMTGAFLVGLSPLKMEAAAITQITHYTGSAGFWSEPVAEADKVVWYAHLTSVNLLPNYYVYDIASAQTTQITSYAGGNGYWGEPVIKGGKVVWYFNDTNVNDLPTISDIGNQATTEDTATGALAFTIGDAETPTTSLTVTGSSSDQILIPNGNLVFGGTLEGNIFALDAETGNVLWRFLSNDRVYASPISFLSRGKQHVSLAAGDVLITFSLDGE